MPVMRTTFFARLLILTSVSRLTSEGPALAERKHPGFGHTETHGPNWTTMDPVWNTQQQCLWAWSTTHKDQQHPARAQNKFVHHTARTKQPRPDTRGATPPKDWTQPHNPTAQNNSTCPRPNNLTNVGTTPRPNKNPRPPGQLSVDQLTSSQLIVLKYITL